MKYFLTSAILLACILQLSAQSAKKPAPKSLDSLYQAVKWRNIGPFRGGRSVCASGVMGDPLTYYMGTTGGGMWKTEDAGQHWKNISDGYFKTGSVGAVAVSESDPNIVYVGMGEHAPRGVMTSHGDGVYKSTNGGKSWTHMGLAATQHISRIVIHPKNPDILYVAAQGALHAPTPERGIYQSKDGGVTWNRIHFVNELTGCSELSMDMNNPQVLYAAMWEHQRKPWIVISGGEGSGLYKTTDGGKTWNKIHKGLPKEKGKMAIAVARSNSDKVYALIESDSDKEKGGLFVSGDAGKSWKRISKDHRLVQRAWYYIELFIDPNNEQVVYVLSAPALRSIDGGKSWSRLSGTHGDFHDLWINPNNSKNMVIANDGGAAISFNYAKTWSRQSNMPTAQFYRVNVDNQFPYRIYAGQQDNSSVIIANRELKSSGITERSWTYSAGGESAFLAFDPDNPRYVLGGSYLGTIEVLDTKAEAGTKIMAAPIQYLGRAARDMKYLFNWNAPIIWSQHEPNTYYHGAQYLLRTRDMGQTWEEVSPDLTRNQDDKQGKGGGPYTVEAVGAENYGTLSYVVESPHEKGVIWTGSDDGYVHVTRNGGEKWNNVTPKDLEECLINAIELSPHDKSTAYIATTRYKFNDKRPSIYKTTNYGKSWTKISDGIPDGSFTRVVREDPGKKNLLFAGTETGMFVSWNGGQQWQPFQLNLPVTPILDMIIRHGDVIVATSGRSFWILDDLGLIRQHDKQGKEFVLFQPEDAYLSNHRSELNSNSPIFKGSNPLRGINPANGIVLYYHLPKLAKSSRIELEIRDSSGKLINRFSSKKDSTYQKYDGGPPPTPSLSRKRGMNRFVWDMRHSTMPGIPKAYIEGSYRGHKAIPGRYTMVLKQGSSEAKSSVNILANPLYPTTAEGYVSYDECMSGMEKTLTDMHKTVNKLYKMQGQLGKILKTLPKESAYTSLRKEGKALAAKLKSWDEEMVQRKSKAYDDVENFPNKFTAEYLFLINQTESDIPRVTKASQDRLKDLDAQWKALQQGAMDLLGKDIPAFNQKLWEKKIGAIWVGK
ncbi:MAG: glycosyl hydrolase [Bacteroidota bacterium]